MNIQCKSVHKYLFIFIVIVTMFSCQRAIQYTAINGVIDLSTYNIMEEKPIEISGEWLFCRDKFITFEDFNTHQYEMLRVTSSFSGEIAGTWYVKILLNESVKGLSLGITNKDINTAAIFYANGEELFKVGNPALDKKDSVPAFYYQTAEVKETENIIHLVIHFSNHELISGGISKSPIIGNIEKIRKNTLIKMIINMFLIGGIMVMIFYHLLIYTMRRKEYSSLVFSIIAFAVVIRTLSLETYLYRMFSNNYGLILKIEYITFFVILSATLYFVFFLYPLDFNIYFNRVILVINSVMIVCTIPFNLTAVSYLNRINQFLTLICIVYVFTGIGRAIYYKRPEIRMFSFGISLLVLATLNDILFYMKVIDTFQMAHYGMFLFILFQSGILSIRFSKAFVENEELNLNLEKIVEKRTAELNLAIDELQQINDKNKKDLTIAQSIQSKLIPTSFPQFKNIQFESFYLPMDELGGDLFDIYPINDDLVGCMILDVCGHGVAAALITTMAKIVFNNAVKVSTDPQEIMRVANSELYDSIHGSGDFLTAFFCVIDTKNMRLTYSNAGHCEMFLLRSDGRLHQLKTNGPIIGVMKDMTYGFGEIELLEKDRLILYTDGVIEAKNSKSELYDLKRLLSQMKMNRTLHGSDCIKTLISDIMIFNENMPFHDDIAIMVIDVMEVVK